MKDFYLDLFPKNILRNMLVLSNKIKKDDSDEVMYDVFLNWIEKNKQFRQQISILNENELKSFVNLLENEFNKVKDLDQSYFPFDSLKLYLKKFILKNSLNIPEPKENKLTPLSFSKFLEYEDKKQYYIKNMFAKGTINMIFSPPASMKSFVSYYMALCLATGTPFLNQKVKKVNIGYFDWENPVSDIQNRIKGICEGMKFDINNINNFYFFSKQPTLLKVTNHDSFVIEDLKQELLEFIKENEIKVLFFDTLRRLGNFDENDSGAINTIKSELFDPLINECNVCVIFLHHTSKEGKNYRGSVDIEGILDTAFSITKKEKEDSIHLNIKNTKRRNNEIEEICAIVEIENDEIEDEDGDMLNVINSVKFNKVVEDENKEESNYSEYRSFIINNLEFGKKYKNKELCETLSYNFGISSTATNNRIIKWLVSINILKSFGEYKSKYYVLNPSYAEREDSIKLKNYEKHILELFIENDMVSIDLIKEKVEEPYYSLLINKWIASGWLNQAKQGYLKVTELFEAENKFGDIEINEVNLR